MPTSVLLAVLAAAGLLALAPALVRRYDAAERLEAERAQSAGRVLPRSRRRRTVPGRRPVNLSRVLVPTLRVAIPRTADRPAGSAPRFVARSASLSADHEHGYLVGGEPGSERHDRRPRGLAVVPRSAPPARRPARPRCSPAVYRRRRVLAALVLLNVVKLVGVVVVVGPGFWIGVAVTGTVLLGFLVHLRNLALADRRRRRALAREQAWLAARQAEVRLEQERRTAARRAATRRMAGQRESLRRAADGWSAPPTVSYRRAGG